MLVVVLVVLGGTAGLGFLAGLGNAAVLAGLTALFCLIAAIGGPLRADLKLLAGFAPALVLAVGVPRLLGEVSHWAAIALLTVVIFVAGLLPALGSRYVTVGLGLGMASLFGYGFQLTGTASAGQIIGAPALAVGVVIVLRVLTGLGDPGKPVREALADALTTDTVEAQERAARLWLGDRPVRWTARVLGGSLRFRAVHELLAARSRRRSEALEAADEEAAKVADLIRAKEPSTSDSEPVDRPGTGRLAENLWSTLDSVRDAALDRDESRVDIPKGLHRDVMLTALRGSLSWRSAQLRHAVRCALGVLLALSVATVRPGDPLTVSFLMTTFAIMQPEWQDSLSKAWQRIAGSMAGAVVLALVIWLLPQAALVPVGLVAVLAGFSVMRSKPLVFNGCMVLMAVGVNATTRHLDPGTVLLEYLLLMFLAAGIGLLFGFAAVPGIRKPGMAERFANATGAVRELLRAVADSLGGKEIDRRELGMRFRATARARQDLVTAEPGSTEPTHEEREAAQRAVDALTGLSAAASSLLFRDHAALAGAVTTAADALEPGTAPDPDLLGTYLGAATDDEQRLLLDTMVADVVALNRASAHFTA